MANLVSGALQRTRKLNRTRLIGSHFKNDNGNAVKDMLIGLFAVFMFSLTLPATRLITAAWTASTSELVSPLFIGFGRAVLAAIIAAIILLVRRSPLSAENSVEHY